MENDNQIRYVNQPSRVTAFLPMIMLAVVVLLAMFILMALGFKDSPFLSAGFVIIIMTIVISGAVGWVSDDRQRGRAHSEQLTRVHETVPQAVAPAVANAVMQILGGIVAQTWPAGDSGAPPQVINHRPPQAVRPQLPARVITVPRNVVYNQAVPAGVQPYQPIVLETITGKDDEMPDQTLQVPLNLLMRFAACPTPSRGEWQGKAEVYTEAARFFRSHGMLAAGARNGHVWKPEYPLAVRRDWLLQYEGAGARARETAPLAN